MRTSLSTEPAEHVTPELPRLLLLTDRTLVVHGRDLADLVEECVSAGVRAVVVRELDLPETERTALVREIRGRTRPHRPLVVSARRWLQGADGVHLAAAQTSLDARPAPFHGRSCHDVDEVRRAVGGGAAYLTASPFAETETKPGHGPPLGAEQLRRLVKEAEHTPVFALGGITSRNTAAATRAGAFGVAVMGAVMRSDDPTTTIRQLQEEVGP